MNEQDKFNRQFSSLLDQYDAYTDMEDHRSARRFSNQMNRMEEAYPELHANWEYVISSREA